MIKIAAICMSGLLSSRCNNRDLEQNWATGTISPVVGFLQRPLRPREGSDLPRVTQLVNGGVGTRTHLLAPFAVCFSVWVAA